MRKPTSMPALFSSISTPNCWTRPKRRSRVAESKIEWTDKVWNPVRGCSLVSQGCKNCYAMRQAHRMSGPGQPYERLTVLNAPGPTWTGKVVCDKSKLDEPLHWKKPCRIFVN